MNEINRGHVYHTLDNKIIDLRKFNYNKSQSDSEFQDGWEAAMYWSNIYNHDLDSEYISILPGDIYVDLGANIGMSATYAELKGASKIYCIEPDPVIYECLKKNSGDNWILENIAVSNYIGSFEMGYWPDVLNNRFKTKCTTLYEYMVRNKIDKIDYLKIDIEGCEDDLVRSIEPATWNKISKIFVEYHYGYENDKVNDFIKIFTEQGFNYNMQPGTQALIKFWK